jgi:hypothetical protein
MIARETKRRYAHELYPHPDEWEVQPLAEAVPYLYARAIGLDVWGTGWFDLRDENGVVARESFDRTNLMIAARHAALHADALLQGLAGEEAWKWAEERGNDETGEWIYDRAVHYGVPVDWIRRYACGPEPRKHDHAGPKDRHGWRSVTTVDGPESECEDCTFVPQDEAWREEWSMVWGDGLVFPFVEDENANITGFGHQDPTEFAEAVNLYDETSSGERLPEDEQWTADHIAHRWAVLDADGERCWTSWPPPNPNALDIDMVREPVTENTRGAFPITTLWGQR